MNDFFNRYFNIKKIMEDKKEFKLYKKRISELPEDYKNAMEGIEVYMFSTCGNESTVMEILYGTLEMFEENVAEGKKVTDIIGNDLGAFCEDINKAFPGSNWIDNYKKKIQKRINKKMDKKL